MKIYENAKKINEKPTKIKGDCKKAAKMQHEKPKKSVNPFSQQELCKEAARRLSVTIMWAARRLQGCREAAWNQKVRQPQGLACFLVGAARKLQEGYKEAT